VKRPLRQYQVVIARLQTKSRDDEDAVTDLLNERERAGWRYASMTAIGATKLLVVFTREA
jgi:hypothetical protein